MIVIISFKSAHCLYIVWKELTLKLKYRPVMKIQLFAKFILSVSLAGSPAFLHCQSNRDGSMPQYLFQDFTTSKVIMKNGQMQTPNLNYNTITERMVFIRDGNYYDIANTGMVDTVIIRDVRFIPVGEAFFEVLIRKEPSLFLQYKGSLMPAGKPAGYGGTSQLASSTYISSVNLSSGRYNLPIPADFIVEISPVYWFKVDNEMKSFVNERQFLGLFPGKEGQLKDFIKKNRIKIDRKEDVIKLVNYCNSLIN